MDNSNGLETEVEVAKMGRIAYEAMVAEFRPNDERLGIKRPSWLGACYAIRQRFIFAAAAVLGGHRELNQGAAMPAVLPTQKPSLGRIVIYHAEHHELAAIFVGFGHTCGMSLAVFLPTGGLMNIFNIVEGTSSGQWSWPERAA